MTHADVNRKTRKKTQGQIICLQFFMCHKNEKAWALMVEIGEALKRMKGGKSMGPDGIPIEVWRCLGDRAIVWLTKLFNLIFRSNKMPEEWRRSILVTILKNKGDVQNYTNYRGIKLISHTMKF